jgi:hypothetical protein
MAIIVTRKRNISQWVFEIKFTEVSGLKSASTPHISIHWRRYLKSRSDFSECSNQRPFHILRSMADLLVSVRIRACASDVIEHRFDSFFMTFSLNILKSGVSRVCFVYSYSLNHQSQHCIQYKYICKTQIDIQQIFKLMYIMLVK